MTIQEALDKATEGGYRMHGSDGIDTSYDGAKNEFSGWTRRGHQSSFLVPTEETFARSSILASLRTCTRLE